jgi:hypothetical protein
MGKRKIIISLNLLLAVAVVAVGIKLVSTIFNSPSQGSINYNSKTAKLTSNSLNYTPNLTPKPIVGKYADFSYPAGLMAASTNPQYAPYEESFKYTHQDVESWILAIDVLTYTNGQLSNNSAYTLRKNNPTQYQESHMTINGQSIDIMTDKTVGGFSKVAFLVKGDSIATVSLLGDDTAGLQPLETTFNMVLTTWRWL